MPSENTRKLNRYQVGALPILYHFINRLGLKEILLEYLPPHKNESISSVDTLILLVCNLALGKTPLYKLAKWVDSIDLRVFENESPDSLTFNDDRFGRALDKLYNTDRASLVTKIVLSIVKNFDISLDQIHNDSTSIAAYGEIPGVTETGVEFKCGHSKDHRPDLKQILFNLCISADGGVPVHHKTYSGNKTDDSTHIETWNALFRISKRPNFLYVADSKLCTDEQLHYIVSNGGRAITIVPNIWGECKNFKDKLRISKIPKKEIWRKTKPGTINEQEYFCAYQGDYRTKRGYKIHWIYSSKKKEKDRTCRNKKLKKAEKGLAELIGNLNTRSCKTKESIQSKAMEILKSCGVEELIEIKIGTTKSKEVKQLGRGRPSLNTEYEEIITEIYTLCWVRNTKAIREEMNFDGVFPLLSTDVTLSSEKVLKTYKYQPKIEKRFSQLKSIHNASTIFFKNIGRVESNMLVFFMAMIVQALVEREIRSSMKQRKIPSIDVYPEYRCSSQPTANAIFELFEPISTYRIMRGTKLVESYHDELDDTQKLIVDLLGLGKNKYWSNVA